MQPYAACKSSVVIIIIIIIKWRSGITYHISCKLISITYVIIIITVLTVCKPHYPAFMNL